jgi:hypothetical protein
VNRYIYSTSYDNKYNAKDEVDASRRKFEGARLELLKVTPF